ncbi:MAG: glutamine--fructose-6-phosphate transaminase (isomerizing) [Deferribacteraceae bacterium]|jgi:glucosamine--fructose-6-phosphate aminotransferase (isomerizing)|nr:glutamine--fructose-6-phosphate transaminase (isomerizing) [Deferribacteraceae bacterium]
MCGIVGYFGKKDAVKALLDGLSRLEYRGYDSAGVAIPDGDSVSIIRTVGKLENLKAALSTKNIKANMGIGHTRWATHGRPSEINAHPHRSGSIVLVHNGIVENYIELKESLEESGYSFISDTDTEVLAHLIRSLYRGDLFSALRDAVSKVRGSYAIAVIDADKRDRIVVTRRDVPLVLGVDDINGEYIAASDIPAALNITRDFIMLEDGGFAQISADGVTEYNPAGEIIQKKITHIDWDPVMAEKDGYPDFMLKEINEQPRTLMDTLRGKIIPDEGKIYLGELEGLKSKAGELERIVIVACGTSLHSGMIGKLYIESYAILPVEVDIASEFLQRSLPLSDKVLVICISQSGETADTKQALRLAKKRGAKVAAICNVLGSAIASEADYCIYTHAGPEISVASTKAFTSQTIVLLLFSLWLGEQRDVLGKKAISEILNDLLHIPDKLKAIFADQENIKSIALKYIHAPSFLFIARHYNYPIAFEGALKLKEISYIHAEGYCSGELKHGPIALLSDNFPVMVYAPAGTVKDKVFSAIEEVQARGASVIAVISEDAIPPSQCSDIIRIPETREELSVLLTVVVSQLFAYYAAKGLNRDVDKPRNLAKSVTVE